MSYPPVRDFFKLAVSIARRRHRTLFERFKEDVEQECRLLAWEAESRKTIVLGHGRKNRKRYGDSKRMGVVSYSRAVNAALVMMTRNYDKPRSRNYGSRKTGSASRSHTGKA